MHQVVETTGTVKPCCMSVFPDDETKQEWKEIFWKRGIRTEVHEKARQQMIAGEWPSICTVCKDAEELGIKSHRQTALEKYKMPDEPRLKYLDIKFSNTCNLACRMCKPSDSSIIAEVIASSAKEDIPKFIKDDYWIPKDYKFQSEDKVEYTKIRIADGLEILKVTGGEPLACKYFMQVIDWAVEEGFAKNLEINFTTNLTKINKPFLEKLKKFKKVRIIISADGTNKIYNYIRQGSSWNKFKQNFELLSTYINEDFEAQVACVLQFYNILDFKNLVDYADQYGVIVSFDYMLRPANSELYYTVINEKIKTRALEILKEYEQNYLAGRYTNHFSNNITNEENIKKLKYSLEQPINEDMKEHLLNTVSKQDKFYNKSYREYLHPLQIEFLDNINKERNCNEL
jgi:MoaA/NifB/PqqE/SkfB family radical SAM enzyme